MDFDAAVQLAAVERSTALPERDGRPARTVTLARSFAATLDDLWDAVTNAQRIPRWFAPVSGNLEPGGHYQLEGNAGGTITTCRRPSSLALTWEFGGQMSWVEVRLADDGAGRARLTLTHTSHLAPPFEQYGPGATGVDWEMALGGLALHLEQPAEPKPDEAAFAASPEGKAFITGSSDAWGQAAVAAGEDPDAAKAAARRTAAFYTGEAAEPDEPAGPA